jgi:tRNA(Leu) C34 or U34 (ribose-2'-O)-methylase TrmL
MNNRGLAGIGLYIPRKQENIGGILRAAYNFDASFIAIAGTKYKKNATDTPKAYRHIPLFHVTNLKEIIPYDCIPVAVDLLEDATPLPDYIHPRSAFYIFGPENGTLGQEVTDWCDDKIYIPTTQCMNLAATVNVILYDRLAKRRTSDKDSNNNDD